jgi:hypothetical protein
MDVLAPPLSVCFESNFDMPRLANRIPLWLKLAYTSFMVVLLPVYWHSYGPTNFLYFCDLALLLTLVGIWMDSALLISMSAVGIVIVQAVWIADFLGNLLGYPIVGITDYMFESHRSLLLRGLSLFHGWLPMFLVFLVWRIGYDRRALWVWSALSCVILLICFFFMPPPNPNPGLTPVNVNYVWGFSDHVPQTWVSPAIWLVGLIVGLPILAYAPAHFLFMRFMPRAPC